MDHLKKFDPMSDEGLSIGYLEIVGPIERIIWGLKLLLEFIYVKLDETDDYLSYSYEVEIRNLEEHVETTQNIQENSV